MEPETKKGIIELAHSPATKNLPIPGHHFLEVVAELDTKLQEALGRNENISAENDLLIMALANAAQLIGYRMGIIVYNGKEELPVLIIELPTGLVAWAIDREVLLKYRKEWPYYQMSFETANRLGDLQEELVNLNDTLIRRKRVSGYIARRN